MLQNLKEKKIVVVTWTKMEDTRRTNKRYRNEKYSVRNENIAGQDLQPFYFLILQGKKKNNKPET